MPKKQEQHRRHCWPAQCSWAKWSVDHWSSYFLRGNIRNNLYETMPINSFTCRISWSCHHVAKDIIKIWYKVSSWVSCNQATPTSTQKPHHEPFPQCPSTSCSWRRFLNKQASLSHQLSKASSTAPFCSVAGCCMKSVKAGDFWVWTGLQFYSLKVLVMIHCGDVML